MSNLQWIIFTNLLLSPTSDAYRALVVVPLPSKSHSILGDSLVKLIVDAGNQVTYLTSFPQKDPPARVKQIEILEEKEKNMWSDGLDLKAVLDGVAKPTDLKNFITLLDKLYLATLQNREFQMIMNEPNEKFDVIIAIWLYSEIYAGLAAVFDCPLIWLSTVELYWKILHLVDVVPNPAYNADNTFSNVPPFTFLQRVQELGFQVYGFMLQYFYTSSLQSAQYNNIIAPIIRKRGKIVPNFEELIFNASLVLGNSHVSLGSARSLPTIYKPIAGYHIPKTAEPLTGDLKNLLDSAKFGVIYFSLGSNLKSETFPDDLKSSLLKMFGGFKQTVLWKFEDNIPDRPSNVHIIPWAPQKSILAHQNCIIFITHGGFLSMTEAVHFGKPVIGIPVFGDQFGNIARAVNKGFARKVDLSYRMADDIGEAIQEMLNNPSYAVKAKEVSFIYFDRPASPATELIHWVEHVVQTRGALHLRSPALLVHWYQKVYLDLMLVTLAMLYGFKVLIKRINFILFKKERSEKKNI